MQIFPAFGQKYTFAHYDIDDGLVQSQVNKFSVDNEHRLWIGTYGGACRFDGKDFIAYSRQNGLPNNYISSVFADKTGRVWLGTLDGLAMLDKGKIKNYKPATPQKHNIVTTITQDREGNIWVVVGFNLFKISGDKMEPVMFDDSSKVTTIAIDATGKLYAAAYGKGIYSLNGKVWEFSTRFNGQYEQLAVRKILFDKFDKQKTYLLTWKGLFYIINNQVMPYAPKQMATVKGQLLCIEQDAYRNLWIGTDNGAYCVCSDDYVIHYNASNGLTDISIADIYVDADNNTWLGSLGNGVYRCEGSKYVTFDGSQGLPESKIIMGITKDWNDQIVLGADGGGLIRYDGQKLVNIATPLSSKYLAGIQCLYTDKNKTIWIGTSQAGLWQYDQKGFRQIKNSDEIAYHAITADNSGVIWLATSMGCYYYEKGTLKQLEGVPEYSSSLTTSGRDSVFIGTQNGVVLLVNKKVVKRNQGVLKNSAVLAMIKYHNLVLIGTDDRGLFTWNLENDHLESYTTRDGLKANTIYSLTTDDTGNVWVGTGKGVNQLKFVADSHRFMVVDNSGSKEPVVETNQNAILYKDHRVWVGTTKSVMVYNTRLKMQSSQPPHIIIENVKLMPQFGKSKDTAFTCLNNGASLNYNQNHLAISFLGVYLKNPTGVSYRYKLVGLDSTFCAPVKNNVVEYPMLPPGKYTFRVKAISPDGKVSPDTANFSFEIIPPFYKTLTFQISAVLFFVLIGFGLQNIWHHNKIQRQQVIEAIKQEEKIKIRQQTAEDFHDDLGNKLTRISILSEILNAKIDQTKTDQHGLVDQIKQNAAALYNGTKDILWALDPKSDNLYETLVHIKEIGIELFQDVPANFEFDKIDESLKQVKLPMEYSRNITMIYKELLNNALKHAEAGQVTMHWGYADKDEISLCLTDDGKGFNSDATFKGHGMHNIKARAKRISAGLMITSEEGRGTSVELRFRKNVTA